ncbi:glycosyltransferase [Amylibacter sp.]|nr:glycosyltransferase [Amylibacter sp.]
MFNILVSAYACSPYQGSEAGVGWGFVKELSATDNLTVFVEQKFQNDIEDYCHRNSQESVSTVNFIFVKRTRLDFLRMVYPPSYYWTYRLWQWNVYRIAKNLIRTPGKRFDLCHHLTMVGFREPGFLYRLELPFVVGPVGGAGFFPKRFLGEMGFKVGMYYLMYNIFNSLHMRFHFRLFAIAKRKQTTGFAATQENQNLLNYYGFGNVPIIPEIGLDGALDGNSNINSISNDLINIVWCGKLIARKGLKFLLKALSNVKSNTTYHLHILGDGPLNEEIRNQIQSLKLNDRVTLYGDMPRLQAIEIMKSCDIGVITSLRDLTSSVTVEFKNAELAMIVPNHSGFQAVCNTANAIMVDITNPQDFEKNIEFSLKILLDDAHKRRQLQQQSSSGLDKLYWKNKVARLRLIYSSLISAK